MTPISSRSLRFICSAFLGAAHLAGHRKPNWLRRLRLPGAQWPGTDIVQPVKINHLVTDLICQVVEKIFADKLGRNGLQAAERCSFKGADLQGIAEESVAVLPFAGRTPAKQPACVSKWVRPTPPPPPPPHTHTHTLPKLWLVKFRFKETGFLKTKNKQTKKSARGDGISF